MDKRNYFREIASQMYQRRWTRYPVSCPAEISVLNQRLTVEAARRCFIVDISKGGAALEVLALKNIPKHFYLSPLAPATRIGCIEIHRKGSNRIGVQFIREIDDDVLKKIVEQWPQ